MFDIFSTSFLYALGAIVLIDLVLAGDNALVIAMASRKLPDHLRKRAILWGTFGAIAVRTVMTFAVVWLLQIPGLLAIGGIALVWIAVRLLAPKDDGEHNLAADVGFWGAMKTIVIADAVMGVDNVLAVAGAAHGNYLLVGLGLLISIPIVVWGSNLVLKLIDRFPSIIYLGAVVLAWTAAKMIISEPMLKSTLAEHAALPWLVYAVVIGAVLGLGYWINSRKVAKPANPASSASPPDAGASPAVEAVDAVATVATVTAIPAETAAQRFALAGRIIDRASVPVEVVLSGTMPVWCRMAVPMSLGMMMMALAWD